MAFGRRWVKGDDQALFTVKSNLDSGIPQAIQLMAVEALRGPQTVVDEHNAVLQARRDKLVKVLHEIGLHARMPDGTFYVWARVPEGYSCVDLTRELLEQVHVAVTPGIGYGASGANYIRFSITLPMTDWRKVCAASRDGGEALDKRTTPATTSDVNELCSSRSLTGWR